MLIHKNGKPVHIYTHPWNWKAIFLYLFLGFKLQKAGVFSHYVNEYSQAMSALRKIVTEVQFDLPLRSSRD